eukprot:1101615-Amphidinium_carterae.1
MEANWQLFISPSLTTATKRNTVALHHTVIRPQDAAKRNINSNKSLNQQLELLINTMKDINIKL